MTKSLIRVQSPSLKCEVCPGLQLPYRAGTCTYRLLLVRSSAPPLQHYRNLQLWGIDKSYSINSKSIASAIPGRDATWDKTKRNGLAGLAKEKGDSTRPIVFVLLVCQGPMHSPHLHQLIHPQTSTTHGGLWSAWHPPTSLHPS